MTPAPRPPLTDHQLDDLFARVRQPGPEDEGAAERFLGRQAQAAPRPHPTWWPAVLAAAALMGGLLVLRPAPADHSPLPASAAYEAYTSALGSEW